MIDYSLYAITDRSWLKPGEKLADAVEKAILGGATIVQLREKKLDKEDFLKEAKILRSILMSNLLKNGPLLIFLLMKYLRNISKKRQKQQRQIHGDLF